MQNIILSIIGTMLLLYGAVQIAPTGINYIKIEKANALVKQEDEILEAVQRYIINYNAFPLISTELSTVVNSAVEVPVVENQTAVTNATSGTTLSLEPTKDSRPTNSDVKETVEEKELYQATPTNILTTNNYLKKEKLVNPWGNNININVDISLGTVTLETEIPNGLSKDIFMKSNIHGFKPYTSTGNLVKTTFLLPLNILPEGTRNGVFMNSFIGEQEPPAINTFYKFWYKTTGDKLVLKIKGKDAAGDDKWYTIKENYESWAPMDDKNTVTGKANLPDTAKEGEFRYVYNKSTGTVDLYSFHNNIWSLVLSINNKSGCMVSSNLFLDNYPAKSATEVSLDETALTLKFSKDVDTSSISSGFSISPNPISSTCQVKTLTSTNDYVCPIDLAASTTYSVKILDTIKNKNGVSMCSPISYIFKTASCSNTLIKSVSPNNNPTEIPYKAPYKISVTFNKNMNNSTFSGFTEVNSNKFTENNCQYDDQTMTYSCNVSGMLANTQYNFQLKNVEKIATKKGVTLCSGINKSIKFKTIKPCANNLVHKNPPANLICMPGRTSLKLERSVSYTDLTTGKTRNWYLVSVLGSSLVAIDDGWLSSNQSASNVSFDKVGSFDVKCKLPNAGTYTTYHFKIWGKDDSAWKNLTVYGSQDCETNPLNSNLIGSSGYFGDVAKNVWTSNYRMLITEPQINGKMPFFYTLDLTTSGGPSLTAISNNLLNESNDKNINPYKSLGLSKRTNYMIVEDITP